MARSLVVALAQWAPAAATAQSLRDIGAWLDRATEQGAEIVVFPEYSQSFNPPFSDRWVSKAEDLDGEFVNGLRELSEQRSSVLVIAGMLERVGDQVFNTLVAVDATGLVGVNRKIHLFDAFDFRESDYITRAHPNDVQLVERAAWKIGLQTCFDIRFPEVSRRLVDAGANLLVVPSQWVPGPHKTTHWLSLLAARAIECQSWVVAVDHPAPHGIGSSVVIDPNGERVALAGDGGELVVTAVNLEVVEAVRALNPMANLRRFDVSWRA